MLGMAVVVLLLWLLGASKAQLFGLALLLCALAGSTSRRSR